MENASKALIIAGSILISILLISIGLVVFNSTSGMLDETKSSLESIPISMFNQRFTRYFGDSVPGSQAKELVDAVKTNNLLYKKNKGTHIIYINFEQGTVDLEHLEASEDLQNVLNSISNSSNYKIYLTDTCGQYRQGKEGNKRSYRLL